MRYPNIRELYLKCLRGQRVLSSKEQSIWFRCNATMLGWVSAFQSQSCIAGPSFLSYNSYLLDERTKNQTHPKPFLSIKYSSICALKMKDNYSSAQGQVHHVKLNRLLWSILGKQLFLRPVVVLWDCVASERPWQHIFSLIWDSNE